MKIITLNVNGIRSAARKGLFDWLPKQKADIICLQEIRAQDEHLQDSAFKLNGYKGFFVCAKKKGYSGVGIYTKQQPDKVITKLGWANADDEGRYLELQFKNLGLNIVSIYLPSGTSGDERQAIKYEFLDKYLKVLTKQRKQKEKFIICGDLNIAHKNIDLKNWKNNQKNSGFLPEERAWLDNLFDNVGFIDAFRYLHPNLEQYTWWSNRGKAWDNNVGWRIDYQVVSPQLAGKIISASVYREHKFSDHAPLVVSYDV